MPNAFAVVLRESEKTTIFDKVAKLKAGYEMNFSKSKGKYCSASHTETKTRLAYGPTNMSFAFEQLS